MYECRRKAREEVNGRKEQRNEWGEFKNRMVMRVKKKQQYGVRKGCVWGAKEGVE